jgi:hypothetical protein
MAEVPDIISTLLYFLVGAVCLLMAHKCIFSKKYLPFHEKAADKPWAGIDKSLRDVILTILRISGLGFLIVSLLLTIFPVVNIFKQDVFIKFSIPIISFIYCFGLFLFNYLLFKQTNAKTPWIGSLIAMFIIIISFCISIV